MSNFNADQSKRVAVLGAGTMGIRIAFLIATKGHEVLLWNHGNCEGIPSRLSKSGKVEGRLAGLTKDEIDLGLSRINITSNVAEIESSNYIIEAIIEDFRIKSELLLAINKYIQSAELISTNTSSLSVSTLSSYVESKDKFIGLHFFNPPLLQKFLEICPTPATSDAVVTLATDFVKNLGAEFILVPDVAGFAVNRLLFSMIAEGIRMLQQFNMAPIDIDKAMRLGTGAKAGPLEVADQIGLDVCLSILTKLSETTPSGNFEVPQLLKSYVSDGWLGKKSGRGFYQYKEPRVK